MSPRHALWGTGNQCSIRFVPCSSCQCGLLKPLNLSCWREGWDRVLLTPALFTPELVENQQSPVMVTETGRCGWQMVLCKARVAKESEQGRRASGSLGSFQIHVYLGWKGAPSSVALHNFQNGSVALELLVGSSGPFTASSGNWCQLQTLPALTSNAHRPFGARV